MVLVEGITQGTTSTKMACKAPSKLERRFDALLQNVGEEMREIFVQMVAEMSKNESVNEKGPKMCADLPTKGNNDGFTQHEDQC